MEDYSLIIIGVSIFVAAIIGARSGIATALLEIFAGLIVGAFFVFELSEFVIVMAELGLITLMFMAGLEVDFRFLNEKAKESVSVGVVSYLVPLVVITVSVFLIFQLDWYQSFLFGIALATSSIGIIYPILRKKGPLGPRRKMILSAVMVMDFLSMILLGIFYSDVSWKVVLVLIFVVVVGLVLPKIKKLASFFSESSHDSMAIKMILALLIISQFMAGVSGLDVILIVFVLGMFLADFVRTHESLKEEIETIGFGFLTPIFFFTVGMSISVTELFHAGWKLVLLLGISFVATYIVTYLIAKKHFPRRAHVMAVLFNAPLTVGIVIATVGHDTGVIDDVSYGVLVGTVVISSFIAAFFGRYPSSSKKKA